MQDPSTLATAVASLLSPSLPYLLKIADQSLGEASKRLGADSWDLSKRIWQKITNRSQIRSGGESSKPRFVDAAEKSLNSPSDEDKKDLFRFELEKLFENDRELGSEVEVILTKKSSHIHIQQGGFNISNSEFINLGTMIARDQINNLGSK